MSPDTRWLNTLTAPTAASAVKTTAAPARPSVAPPVETARPPSPPAAEAQSGSRSTRAAAIRARTWRTATWLALRYPSVATFEGLAANPSASLQRGLLWCLAGAAGGLALPALLSLVHGAAAFVTLWTVYAALVLLSVAAVAGGAAVACGLAAHLAAYGLALRPHLLERQTPALASAPGGLTPGTFQKAIYVRLVYACAAYAAPLCAALGVALIAPDLLRGTLLLALSGYGLVMTVLAVRAACRVSVLWAAVAGTAGALAALLPLAAVAGVWVGLLG